MLWDSLFVADFSRTCLQQESRLLERVMVGQGEIEEAEAIQVTCQLRWVVVKSTKTYTALMAMQILAVSYGRAWMRSDIWVVTIVPRVDHQIDAKSRYSLFRWCKQLPLLRQQNTYLTAVSPGLI